MTVLFQLIGKLNIFYFCMLTLSLSILNLAIIVFSGSFFSLLFTNKLPSILDEVVMNFAIYDTQMLKIYISVLYALFLIFYAICNLFLLKISYNQEYVIGSQIFNNRLNEKLKNKYQTKIGEIVKNTVQEPARVTHGYIVPFVHLISKTFQLIVTVSFLMYQDFIFTIISSFFIGISYVLMKIYTTKPIVVAGENCVKLNKERYNIVHESMSSKKDILVYNLQKKFFKIFNFTNKSYVSELFRCDAIATLPRYFLEMVVIILLIFLNFSNTNFLFSEDPQKLFIFAGAALRLIPLAQTIYHSSTVMSFNTESLKVVNKEMNMPFDVIKKQEELIFKFTVQGDQKNNKITIIKGLNGSGKTTFLDCFSRINNSKIIAKSNIKLDLLYNFKKSTYVTQFPAIMSGTVLENIMCTNKKISIKFVNKVCNHFKLGTLLDVHQLSGGQKQLIAIIRAIVNSEGLIIMDEPTSSLDEVKKSLLISYINNDNKNQYLIVSHEENFNFKNQINITFNK